VTVLDDRRTYPKLPHPRWRLPLLGDLLSYDADAARLGPIYELRAFGVRYVVVAGADFITDLNDETRFCKHVGPEIEALRILGGDGLFTAFNDEPNWQKAHDLSMPAFSQAAMRRYHGVMLDLTREYTDNWDEHARAGSTVDVSADTTRVTLETIGRCAAGYSFHSFADETVPSFVEHMVSGLKGADRVGLLRASQLPKFLARREERKVRRDACHKLDRLIGSRPGGCDGGGNSGLRRRRATVVGESVRRSSLSPAWRMASSQSGPSRSS
jgi:cytochrome P450